MKDLSQKIKVFYAGLIKKKETYQRHAIKPTRDWTILLIASSIIFVILAMFAFYVYLQIMDDKLFVAKDRIVIKEEKINTGLLSKTIEDINTRETLTNSLKGNSVKTTNPSK